MSLSKSVDVSSITARFRHSATYIGTYVNNETQGHRSSYKGNEVSQVLIIGGTGQNRESTFGDMYVLEVEEDTHSTR
jgi:hypothetical protein